MSDSRLVVVESPLKGATSEEQRRNFRYALWCCRYAYLQGMRPISSHIICPWFMDDADASERNSGIDWPWVWQPGVKHLFFVDYGMSGGMGKALARCAAAGIETGAVALEYVDAKIWESVHCGEWPPHTAGFGPPHTPGFEVLT